MQQAKEAACNDAALLHSAIYQLLTLHFRQEPYYLDVLELFHDVSARPSFTLRRRQARVSNGKDVFQVSHKANIGQVMDLETRADKTLDLFTMDRYQVITKYKTAYHTFQMPVSLALYMVTTTTRFHGFPSDAYLTDSTRSFQNSALEPIQVSVKYPSSECNPFTF